MFEKEEKMEFLTSFNFLFKENYFFYCFELIKCTQYTQTNINPVFTLFFTIFFAPAVLLFSFRLFKKRVFVFTLNEKRGFRTPFFKQHKIAEVGNKTTRKSNQVPEAEESVLITQYLWPCIELTWFCPVFLLLKMDYT